MGAFTASVTGNFNSSATWGGAGVPGSGDTATINNGVTVTNPIGNTATLGTSPADDTGTPALKTAGSSGTGIFINNGAFVWKGPVRQGNNTWIHGPGSTCTYDASGAAVPANALYTWQISDNNGQAISLQFNGSVGSRCTVNSVGNVQSGGFGNLGTNWQGGGQVQATYTDFSYQGAATSSGSFIWSNLNASADTHLDNCTVDHCAQLQISGPFNVSAGIDPTAIFRVKQTKITNPVNTSFTMQLSCSGATFSTGTRQITNSDIAGRIYVNATDGGGAPTHNDFTIKHNVFRCRDLSTGTMPNPVELNGTTVAAWDQNLVAMITTNTSGSTQDPAILIGGGTYTNSYLFRLGVPTAFGANMHPVYLDQRTASIALTGWVFHQLVQDTFGDVVNLTREATAARTVQVKNSIYLPNTIGNAAGSLVNQQGAVNQTNTVITFDHNTVGGGVPVPDTSVVYGVGCEAGATWPAGAVASIRSNLLWCLASHADTVCNSATPSATVSASAVTVADYNGTFNISTTIYGNPSAQFASGHTHDVTGDPQFVDKTRTLATFDQGYLAASVATAWVTSTVYAVGDLVSVSDAGWYSGQTQNWRCVTAHTSGATTKPESGASFTANWEPACLKSISDDILNGTLYSAGANSLIGELVAWVKAGFAPTNSIYHNTAHDSTDIGAVPFPVDVMPPTTVPPRILGTDGKTMTFAMSEACQAASGTTGFTLHGLLASSNSTAWSVDASGNVSITFGSVFKTGDTLTITSLSVPILDVAGNQMVDLDDAGVTNNSTVTASTQAADASTLGLGLELAI